MATNPPANPKRARAKLTRQTTYRVKCLTDDAHTLRRVTPKRYRPRCGQPCADGHPCQAPVLWDRERNRPAGNKCFRHGVAGWRRSSG